eukprot:gene24959-10617_t
MKATALEEVLSLIDPLLLNADHKAVRLASKSLSSLYDGGACGGMDKLSLTLSVCQTVMSSRQARAQTWGSPTAVASATPSATNELDSVVAKTEPAANSSTKFSSLSGCLSRMRLLKSIDFRVPQTKPMSVESKQRAGHMRYIALQLILDEGDSSSTWVQKLLDKGSDPFLADLAKALALRREVRLMPVGSGGSCSHLVEMLAVTVSRYEAQNREQMNLSKLTEDTDTMLDIAVDVVLMLCYKNLAAAEEALDSLAVCLRAWRRPAAALAWGLLILRALAGASAHGADQTTALEAALKLSERAYVMPEEVVELLGDAILAVAGNDEAMSQHWEAAAPKILQHEMDRGPSPWPPLVGLFHLRKVKRDTKTSSPVSIRPITALGSNPPARSPLLVRILQAKTSTRAA